MVVADDLGYGDVTPAGTPNLHALATNGSRFLQFSVASPVCSPSRAGYLTGHWPARHGIHQAFGTRANGVSYGMPAFLDPAAVSLPRLLRSAGFATAHFGKWHLTANDVARAPHPQEYGYDEYKGFNGPPGTAESDVAEIWEDALGFLRRRGEKPAFVVLAAHQPHTPHRPSAAALARFAGERKEQRRVYAAVVRGRARSASHLASNPPRTSLGCAAHPPPPPSRSGIASTSARSPPNLRLISA